MADARRPCAHCGRNRAERFFVSERGRVCESCRRAKRRTSQRAGHVARTYDLDPATYARLLAHQGGVCAICGQERRYALNVDHDHATGAVRGLTCRRCNKVLAMVRDDAGILVTAAAYLTMPPMVTLDTQTPNQGQSYDDDTAKGDGGSPRTMPADGAHGHDVGRCSSEPSPATARVGGDEGSSGRGRPLAPPPVPACWSMTPEGDEAPSGTGRFSRTASEPGVVS